MHKLPSPYEAYQWHADRITGWCSDWISQKDFDKKLSDNPQLSPLGLTEHTPILMTMQGPDSEYHGVLHIMQAEKMIDIETRDGLIWYKAGA